MRVDSWVVNFAFVDVRILLASVSLVMVATRSARTAFSLVAAAAMLSK